MRKSLTLLGVSCFALMLIAWLWLPSFQSNSSNSDDSVPKWPSRGELRAKIRQTQKLLIVYPTGNHAAANKYREYAESRVGQSRWLEIVAKPDTAVTEAELDSLPLSIIGSPAANRMLSKFTHGLPFEMTDAGLTLPGLFELISDDVYTLSLYPNPRERSLPISVVTGENDNRILEVLANQRRSFYGAAEFSVLRNGAAVLLGFFEYGGGQPWQIDARQTRNYLELRHAVVATEHYDFVFHGENLPRAEVLHLSEIQEQRLQKLLQHLRKAGVNTSALGRIEYHLYESPEDKGLITGNTDVAHFDREALKVHVIYSAFLQGTDFYADTRLVFARLIGESKSETLREGVGMLFSEDWGKLGFRHWAKLFYDTDNLVSLSLLFDYEKYNQESYLIMRPLAGSFVEFVIAKFGWDAFLNLYRNWPETGFPAAEIAGTPVRDLEKPWREFIRETYATRAPSSDRKKSFGFQKGFCYAHEGYQIYNGYLGSKSRASLQKLASLGNDWISVTPFGYLRDANQPDPFRFSFGPGSENDESLVTAAHYARQLGMGVMLKPHVLMWRPNWGWPGDVKMQSEADWQKFFDCYYRWIRHYAVLAEMYDMDIFCIGVELMHTTREHQSEWREIIARIRQIYRGPLVYAANWWQEFEQISFWEELDYIGLNLYYPLSDADSVNVENLVDGMNTGMPVIERVVSKYGKPLLLTEVGFTSSPQPWKRPHERIRNSPVSLNAQKLCYEAIFRAFWEKEWLHGVYWWKWPTYLEDGGEQHNGFTPNGKPAEKVVAKWYGDKKSSLRSAE